MDRDRVDVSRRTDDSNDRSQQVSRRHVLTTAGVVCGAAFAGCAGVSNADRRTTTERFSVPGESVDRLVVDAEGEVTVTGEDRTDVAVEVRKFAVGQTDLSSVGVSRNRTGERLTIGLREPMVVGVGGGGVERLDARVPRAVAVERVRTDDGTARVRDTTGDLELVVDDGTGEVNGVDGTVTIDADDADVTVGEVGGVTGGLDDGHLRTTAPTTVGDVTAENGDLDLQVAALDGDTTVETDDGDVEMAVASTLDATVVAATDDGDVDVEGAPFDSVAVSDGTVRGTVGEGRRRLRVTVDDGTVTLRSS
jgi:hypothetical protein